ncbi:MAG: hypothetical protein ACSW75_03630 [Lachnospiraceae bacterium]
MQQQKPKGSVMILVVSILLIVGAAIGLLGGLAAGAASVLFNAASTREELQAALGQLGLANVPIEQVKSILTTTTILVAVTSIFQLIIAIIGLVNRNKVEKAGLLLVLGIVLIVMSLVSNFVPLIMWKVSVSAVSIVTGLILPILFVIGAVMNKNS